MNHRARLPFQERKAPPRSFSPPVFYRPERRDLPERRKTERGDEGKRQRQQRTSEQQLNPCDDDARAPPPSPQRNGDERRLRARVPPTVSCDESGRAGRGPERSQRRRRHRMRGVNNNNNPFITGEPACANRFTRVRKHPISLHTTRLFARLASQLFITADRTRRPRDADPSEPTAPAVMNDDEDDCPTA